MKKFWLLLLSVIVIPAMVVSAGPREDAIAERIKKVGSVCVEGEDCASQSSPVTAVAQNAGGGAEATYNKTCATCHAAGVAGAPKLGDTGAWAPRIDTGMDALYASAINGKPPGMPARGMCFACTDEELKALVDYMVEASQ